MANNQQASEGSGGDDQSHRSDQQQAGPNPFILAHSRYSGFDQGSIG
jgi:hypothetical protein